MLETIRGATKTICFETFIYWSGSIGREFAEALSDRARAGVKVHVMLDWVGSNRIDESLVKLMTDAGVQAVRYHPLRWYNVGRLNNRTHRKLLIVDGRIGFTGGVGHRGQLAGARPGSRSLARLALPPRGPRGGPHAGRLRGQLDGDLR